MKKGKYSIAIDDTIKPLDMREGLWDGLDEAVRLDPKQRFSSRSEAIRHFIINFIEEVEELREGGE